MFVSDVLCDRAFLDLCPPIRLSDMFCSEALQGIPVQARLTGW